MEQIVFIGIIVLFSILEAVVRKNRAKEGGEPEAGEDGASDIPTGEDDRRSRRPSEVPGQRSRQAREVPDRSRPPREIAPPVGQSSRPNHDEDPSFDAQASTSEGMIPTDVWEEIQNIARGGGASTSRPTPPPRAPAPDRTPGQGHARLPSRAESKTRTPVPAPPVPVASTIQAPVRPAGEGEKVHAIHLSHPDYGKPMAGRLTGFAEDAPAPANAQVSVAWIRGGGVERLRQAVVLQELLGPPVSLRDEKSRRED